MRRTTHVTMIRTRRRAACTRMRHSATTTLRPPAGHAGRAWQAQDQASLARIAGCTHHPKIAPLSCQLATLAASRKKIQAAMPMHARRCPPIPQPPLVVTCRALTPFHGEHFRHSDLPPPVQAARCLGMLLGLNRIEELLQLVAVLLQRRLHACTSACFFASCRPPPAPPAMHATHRY